MVIGANDLRKIFIWIDAAYAMNPDMISQTGGIISMIAGVLLVKSRK